MRIATVHLLIDVESDAQACDFLSETLSTMPYVVDWAYAHRLWLGEITVSFDQEGEYEEGDFLMEAPHVGS